MLARLNRNSSLHTGIQPEHSLGALLTHQHVYIHSTTPIDNQLSVGKGDEEACCAALHEVYGSVLGAVVWTVLTRADLAVYVHALQRMAHAPRVQDCKKLNIAILHLKPHKCGLKNVTLENPSKFVAFIGVAFESQPEEPTVLAIRGLAAALCGDNCDVEPMSKNSEANFVDFISQMATWGSKVDVQRRIGRPSRQYRTNVSIAVCTSSDCLADKGVMYLP